MKKRMRQVQVPTVIVLVEGGCVQSASADQPVNVLLVDRDNNPDTGIVDVFPVDRVRKHKFYYSAVDHETGGELYFAGRNSRSAEACGKKVAKYLRTEEDTADETKDMSDQDVLKRFQVEIVCHVDRINADDDVAAKKRG